MRQHGFPDARVCHELVRGLTTSRHLAATQNSVATGALRTWPDLLSARPGRN